MILKYWDPALRKWTLVDGIERIQESEDVKVAFRKRETGRYLAAFRFEMNPYDGTNSEVGILWDDVSLYLGTWKRLREARPDDAPEKVIALCCFKKSGVHRLLVDKGIEVYLLSDIGKTIERL